MVIAHHSRSELKLRTSPGSSGLASASEALTETDHEVINAGTMP